MVRRVREGNIISAIDSFMKDKKIEKIENKEKGLYLKYRDNKGKVIRID